MVVPSAAAGAARCAGSCCSFSWHGAPIARGAVERACYIVPWVDGTLLVGATVEDVGFDERATVAGVRGCSRRPAALLPQAADATFVEARAGLRPSTPDGVPIIGRAPFDPVGRLRHRPLSQRHPARAADRAIVADLVIDDRHDPALAKTAPGR